MMRLTLLGTLALAGCSDCDDGDGDPGLDASMGLDGSVQDGSQMLDGDLTDAGSDPVTCELPIRPPGPLVLTPPAAGAPLQGIFKTDDPTFVAPAYMQPTPDGSYVLAYDFIDNSIKAYHREGPHKDRSQLISANAGSEQGDVVFNRAVTLAYVQDGSAGEILEVDLATSQRTVVAGNNVGEGPSLRLSRNAALNSAETMLYLLDTLGGQLIRVDLCNGDRTVITAGGSPGTGPELEIIFDVVINEAETLAYVVDNGTGSVVSIDLTSGDRVVVSGGDVGSGPAFRTPTELILFDEETSAYVLGQSGDVYIVDLTDGSRSVVPNNSEDPLSRLRESNEMVLAPDGETLLVEGGGINASRPLVEVNPTTGDRSVYFVSRVGGKRWR